MKLFLKRSRGSITVLVTLILVPTIFFSGFLVDLARLKLYGNQAVMTADNYGEAVLSQYDNLLKELYGLFAVTQDEEALKQLDQFQVYMKSSFDPNTSTVSWEHMQAVLGQSAYTGAMPYKDAEVSLSHTFEADANLRTNEVLDTQIGDFMKFRIAQQLLGDGSDVLEAVETIQNMENNAKAVDKKMKLDKEAEKLYEMAQEYYVILKDFTEYPSYIKGINAAYSACSTTFSEITGSDHYQIYYDYETSDKAAMNEAVNKRERIEKSKKDSEKKSESDSETSGEEAEEETESLSSEEQKLVDIYDAYMGDGRARRNVLEEQFDTAIAGVAASSLKDPLDVDTFNERLELLENKADEIKKKGEKIRKLQEELRTLLKDEKLSKDLKEGISEELERMEELFSQLEDYTGIVDFMIQKDKPVNSSYQVQVTDILGQLKRIKAWYLDCEKENMPEWAEWLDESKWVDFRTNSRYKALYESLDKCFGQNGDENEGNKKKKEADKLLDNAKKSMNQEEETTARDVPEGLHYGAYLDNSDFDLSDMVSEATSYFSVNNFKEEANRMVLKFYTVEYDFGMFTSRVTNIKNDTESTGEQAKEVSLTGYEKAPNINYLYQAELEYLLGGSDSSKDNLAAARNKIVAFRTIVNFTATYSVDEVNKMIQAISKSAGAVNPVLGLVVNGALRCAVAGVETAMDWSELKKGNGVVLIKKKMAELTAYDAIKGILGLPEKKEEDKSFQMDYEQYLMVMLMFFTSSDELTQRTADLIELNVNTVKNRVGNKGTLSVDKMTFKMGNAHTAVNAVCTVHLDFVVMPQGFAKAVAKEGDYNRLTEFQKNSYKFTVTRGY